MVLGSLSVVCTSRPSTTQASGHLQILALGVALCQVKDFLPQTAEETGVLLTSANLSIASRTFSLSLAPDGEAAQLTILIVLALSRKTRLEAYTAMHEARGQRMAFDYSVGKLL